MSIEVKHYVKKYLGGFMFSDSFFKPVENRNPLDVEFGQGVYAIQFFDCQELVTEDGHKLVGEYYNPSKTFFMPGSKRLSYQDVIARGDMGHTASNIRTNKIQFVIETPFGNVIDIGDGSKAEILPNFEEYTDELQ